MARTCNVCESATEVAGLEEASVRSNVTAFRSEQFCYWRCAHCRSLHARDEVDLGHYYAGYPLHDIRDNDVAVRIVYQSQLARLVRAGLTRDHAIIDYGCGAGAFVRFMRTAGYRNAVGFDEYNSQFCDREVLERRYDFVLSQDVLEHVPSPLALLDQFAKLARPAGVIAIGTPDAQVLDLKRAEAFVHELHAPYHRHIVAAEALVVAGERRGWALQRKYSTTYANTRIPCMNEAFVSYCIRLAGNDLDHLLAPVRWGRLFWRAPVALFLALFGSFLSRRADVMLMFRNA